jgi:hypothetical protein
MRLRWHFFQSNGLLLPEVPPRFADRSGAPIPKLSKFSTFF